MTVLVTKDGIGGLNFEFTEHGVAFGCFGPALPLIADFEADLADAVAASTVTVSVVDAITPESLPTPLLLQCEGDGIPITVSDASRIVIGCTKVDATMTEIIAHDPALTNPGGDRSRLRVIWLTGGCVTSASIWVVPQPDALRVLLSRKSCILSSAMILGVELSLSTPLNAQDVGAYFDETTPVPTRSPVPGQSTLVRVADLLATLPTSAAGVQFDGIQLVDDWFESGHAVDGVLTSLGKRRSDATSVFRYSAADDTVIGAITVLGVDGATLLGACALSWESEAVTNRTQRTVRDMPAWELEARSGRITVCYQLGNVVYVVESSSRGILESVLEQMP